MAIAVTRCAASARPIPAVDEQRSRPGATADLSPPHDQDDPPATGSELVAHLRAQMRAALPPLHNVARDGRTANAGQHLLVSRPEPTKGTDPTSAVNTTPRTRARCRR